VSGPMQKRKEKEEIKKEEEEVKNVEANSLIHYIL
jgi:hypothetical protein